MQRACTLFTKQGVQFLYHEAHSRLDLVFEHAALLPFAVLVRDLPNASHGSIRNQMVHVLFTEAAWICHLQNVPIENWRSEDFLDMKSLLTAKRNIVQDTSDYLDGLGEAELNRQLGFKPKEWIGPLRSPAFVLHHVVTHIFHHKGQMAMMFRMLGHPIGDTDLQRESE